MKKVLFLAPSLRVGGMERALVTLANQLVQKEYDVTVLLLDTNDDLKDELDSKIHFLKKPYKDHFGKKIPYIRHKYYDDGMWETRATPEQLYRYYIGNEKFDVEIAFFRGLSVKIISGSTNQNAVRLAWVHSDFRMLDSFRYQFCDDRAVKKAYASFDHIICVSQQAMEGFKETVGDTGNLTTVYNLLPIERIRTLSSESIVHIIQKSKLHLVVVARLFDEAKGQLRMIEVVSRLWRETQGVSLTLVGGGQDGERIRQMIEEKNATKYIEMTGSQRNPYPYIRDADLLVCSSYYEGYNLTVAEALILDTPVLSTRCTGPCEILDNGKYGMIVDNSEEGLYQGLKTLYENPDMLREYGEKAKQRQDFFDEEKTLKQILDLI